MAKTQVRSAQIEDGGVKRADLNTATSGSAVLTKAVQGTGISLSSTGADAGTGDVTIALADAGTTYAKIQNISATQRALGRNTSGAGSTEEVTITQLLDWVGSTRGSILYRGASNWAILTPGTSGQVLKSNGSGADPSWTDMNVATIDTGNSSTSTLNSGVAFTGTGLSTLGYGSVSIAVLASHDSAADGLAIEQSTDNSNWDIADYCDVKANQAISLTVNFVAEYYRVIYTNGGTNQTTFRIEAKLNPAPISTPDGGRSDVPSKSAIATLTSTSDAAIVSAPGSNKSLLVRRLTAYNTSATLTRVDIKDDTTVFKYLAAAASGGGEVYAPWRKLLTENKALNGALSGAVTDVRISCEYVVVKS